MPEMCNGICNKYHAIGSSGKGRYAKGQKRCNSCGIFINWDGLRCPCCNDRLRLSPRNSKSKEKFLEIKSVKKRKVLVNGM
jgi:hypothetical protein